MVCLQRRLLHWHAGSADVGLYLVKKPSNPFSPILSF